MKRFYYILLLALFPIDAHTAPKLVGHFYGDGSLSNVVASGEWVGGLNGDGNPQWRLAGEIVLDALGPSYLLWDNGNGKTNMVMFYPEFHSGQNILYIGAGNDASKATFDADSLQLLNTNSSGQFHGQLAPRHTFMFRNPNNGINLGGYTEGWRMERTNFTLSAPFNLGVSQDPATAGFYPSFIAHNNTNWMELGVRQWTTRIPGQVEIGQFAEVNGATNSVSIGNATNTANNTVLIGYNNFNAQFSGSNIRLGGTAFVVSSTSLSLFADAITMENGGNAEFAGDLAVDGAFNSDGGAISTDGAGNATTSGHIELTTANEGIILKSPNGTRYKITVNNAGNIITTAQ